MCKSQECFSFQKCVLLEKHGDSAKRKHAASTRTPPTTSAESGYGRHSADRHGSKTTLTDEPLLGTLRSAPHAIVRRASDATVGNPAIMRSL